MADQLTPAEMQEAAERLRINAAGDGEADERAGADALDRLADLSQKWDVLRCMGMGSCGIAAAYGVDPDTAAEEVVTARERLAEVTEFTARQARSVANDDYSRGWMRASATIGRIARGETNERESNV